MKNVLIITSSFRHNSNSSALAKAFAEGAKSTGNSVETVELYDKSIAFCKGCLACQKTGKCVINDDAVTIAEKMLNADVLVFASPVYYYSISGQLKTMLDRANPLYASDYKFRSVFLLSTAADDDKSAVEGSAKAVQGWVDCFEKAKFECVVFAGGVDQPGDINGHIALEKAFEIGANV